MLCMKTKVVLDVNILISGLVFKTKTASTLIQFVLLTCDIFYSQELIIEYQEVLKRKFKIAPEENFFLFLKAGNQFEPQKKANIKIDPKDLYLLDLSGQVQADYLITGDKEILSLENYENVRIISMSTFLEKYAV